MKKGSCFHFNGIQNTMCNAGVNYRVLSGADNNEIGYARRLPCFTFKDGDQHVSCSKYREPTDLELAEFDNEINESIARFNKAMPLILELKKEFKRRDAVVIRVCPICGNKLHMSIAAYNGHVHGQCETEGCLSWAE